MRPVLVVVGGLPATGKSTVASALAKEMKAPYLRVDRIEQAIVMWSPLTHPVGPVGYAVAHELAAEQLALGLDVIVECVNPIALTRDGWAETGRAAGAAVVEVELICSNTVEHQHRVETRISDVEGLTKPAWPDVLDARVRAMGQGTPGLGHGRDADWQGGRANRDGDRVDQTAIDCLRDEGRVHPAQHPEIDAVFLVLAGSLTIGLDGGSAAGRKRRNNNARLCRGEGDARLYRGEGDARLCRDALESGLLPSAPTQQHLRRRRALDLFEHPARAPRGIRGMNPT